MKQRIASTLLLWAGLIGLLLLLGIHGAVLLLLAATLLSQREVYAMLRHSGGLPLEWTGLTAGALLILGSFYFPWIGIHALTGPFLGLILVIVVILLMTPTEEVVPSFTATLAGLAIAALFAAFVPLLQTGSLLLAVWVIAVAKFTDVGALLIGLRFGRTAFAPVLSPKKTWEGVVGGIVVAAIVSVLFALIFRAHLPPGFTLIFALWAAVPIAIAGIASDLFESAFKRSVKVKDSGNILPGIGGVFDLTDSFLLAAPVGYLLLASRLGGF